MDVYEYYKGLIAFRKAHSALRMTTAAAIQNNLTFMTGLDANVVAYTIQGEVQEKRHRILQSSIMEIRMQSQ